MPNVRKIQKFSNISKDLGNGRMEVICSTEDIDRDGDIIRQNGWDLKQYKNNPVVQWAHDYKQPPIARAEKIWVDKGAKQLRSVLQFADTPFAQEIYGLYQGKFLNAFSVGFISTEWKAIDENDPWGGRDFQKNELLEYSCVPVPANANALAEARSKGFKIPDGLEEIVAVYQEAQENLREVGVSPEDVDALVKGGQAHTPTQKELEDFFEDDDKDVTPTKDTPEKDEGPEADDEDSEGSDPEKGEEIADEKSGRVLSQANFDKLQSAYDSIGTVLESATPNENAHEADESKTDEPPAVPEPVVSDEKAPTLTEVKDVILAGISEFVSAEVTRQFNELRGIVN